jgi:hypothetical protein
VLDKPTTMKIMQDVPLLANSIQAREVKVAAQEYLSDHFESKLSGAGELSSEDFDFQNLAMINALNQTSC